LVLILLLEKSLIALNTCFYICFSVVLQNLEENVNAPVQGQEQAAVIAQSNDSDDEGAGAVNYTPRVDDGPMPELYDLPHLDNDIVAAINQFGRHMNSSYKTRIIEAIFNDMLRFTSYV
jgi:hypothetical protein